MWLEQKYRSVPEYTWLDVCANGATVIRQFIFQGGIKGFIH